MATETQQLIFDILTRDRASDGLSRIGRSASEAAGNTDTLNRRLDELGRKSAEARVKLAGDKDAQASLDKIDAKLLSVDRRTAKPNVTIEGVARATADLAALDLELDKLGSKDGGAAKADGALSSLTVPGGGMGALIGAGVALSPIIATVGTGLVGFGAAAYGAIKPIENAAQKTGGLQANMKLLNPEQQKLAISILGLGKQYAAFEKALQPQVLSVFGKGLQLAGHLMQDVEPVAQATGKALGGVLDRVDAEFKSGTWQQFFAFMAKTAGPDVQLVGNALIALTNTLPPLLEALQPVAVELLKTTTATLQLVGAAAKATVAAEQMGVAHAQLAEKAQRSGGVMGFFAHAVSSAVNQLLPGVHATGVLKDAIDKLSGSSAGATVPIKALADGTANLIHPIGTVTSGLGVYRNKTISATQAAQQETLAVTALNNALTALVNPLLTAEQDQVAWKQAQQAATAAIKADSGSLDTNRAKALAARAAIISSTQSALTFAQAQEKQKGGVEAASKTIQAQIAYLQQHAGKSKIAAQEIDALRSALNSLPKNTNANVNVHGSGSGTITFVQQVLGQNSKGYLEFHAKGYRVPGYGGGDTYGPVMVEPGETIVPKHLTPAVAPLMKAYGVPGFAMGGLVGPRTALTTAIPWEGKHEAAAGTAAARGFAQAIIAEIRKAQAAGLSGSFSGSARGEQRYAESLFPHFGWSAGQLGPLISLWNQESGWNPLAMNPSSGAFGIAQALGHGLPGTAGRYGNQYPSVAANNGNAGAQIAWGLSYIAGQYGSPAGAWAHELCVPLDSQILTRRGWLTRDQVRVGDETVGWNPETGRSEWTEVTAIHNYEDAELVRLSNKTWTAVCTPAHRWVSQKAIQRERGGPAIWRDGFVAARDIGTRHRLRLAAPAELDDGPAISEQEAELLGWVLGDGSVAHIKSRGHPGHWRHGTGALVSMRLYQSKPEHVKRIDALVKGLMFNRMVRQMTKPTGEPGLPLVTWEFSRSYTAELLKRSGYEHRDPVPFVLSLSAAQRAAFLMGVFGAEGWYGGNGEGFAGRGYGGYAPTRTYAQNDGPQQDAIILAIYLSGHRPGISEVDHRGQRVGRWTASTVGATIRETKPFIGGESVRREAAGRAPVWCVSTGLGTWTMRQGRNVMLTGNSFNWYDQGGYLPPGLSLAMNGTGKPERVGGGNTYVINVNVAPGGNLAEAGRMTVNAIREFEKRAGPGWRK